MAYPSVRAVSSSQTVSAGSSIVCTHPSGLTAGDLMVLFVHIYTQSTARTITTPSGWTLSDSVSGLADATNNGKVLSAFTKVATSGDVSAGSTTVSFNLAPQDASFAMYAITGYSSDYTIAGIETDNEQNTGVSTGTTSYTKSFTTNLPVVATDSLVIGCFATSLFSKADTPSAGTSTMTLTPSSSVTPDVNISITDGGNGSTIHWLYTGSSQYSGISTITARQITVVANANIISDTAETSSIILSINSPQSATADVPHLAITPQINALSAVNGVSVEIGHVDMPIVPTSLQTADATPLTAWENETLPSTEWTNENL